MHRRDVLKSALAGVAALAAPSIVRAEAQSTLTFVPHSTMLFSGGEDGAVKLWETADPNSSLLATLLPFRNGMDWLAATPDGFFDGSENGG